MRGVGSVVGEKGIKKTVETQLQKMYSKLEENIESEQNHYKKQKIQYISNFLRELYLYIPKCKTNEECKNLYDLGSIISKVPNLPDIDSKTIDDINRLINSNNRFNELVTRGTILQCCGKAYRKYKESLID
jgi:hypothetical protein